MSSVELGLSEHGLGFYSGLGYGLGFYSGRGYGLGFDHNFARRFVQGSLSRDFVPAHYQELVPKYF